MSRKERDNPIGALINDIAGIPPCDVMKESKRLAAEYGYSFDANSLCITSPGKFEGEWLPVLYFWEAYLNGFGDEEDEYRVIIELSPEEKKQCNTRTKHAVLHTSDQGFVSLSFGKN